MTIYEVRSPYLQSFFRSWGPWEVQGEARLVDAKDVFFGGKAVKAGTYSLFTIPSAEGDWTVILNNARNVWGHYTYKEIEDVIRVKGTVSKSEENIEAFSMIFEDDMTLKMGWVNTVVSVPIKTEIIEK